MHTNSIPRKVLTMSELNNKKVVQHNDLITSVAKMEMVPLKIFELAASCINVEEPPKDNSVYLSKQILFSFFDVSDSNKHSRFKQAIEKMQKQAHFVIRERTNKGFEFESIVPIPYIKWNDYNDEVIIEFNRHIMPYLIDLKKNFTQYAISDIINLSSKYSIIIYKWLAMNYNQYEHYKHKGNRTKTQLEPLKNPIIKIEELREITETKTKYTGMNDFTKRVLDESTNAITENTTLNVEYQKIKKGGRISDIKFFISKKTVVKNEFYKEEQQDPAYLEDKKNKGKEAESLYVEAIGSKYTDLLGDYKLITFSDLRDKEIMAGLKKVFTPCMMN